MGTISLPVLLSCLAVQWHQYRPCHLNMFYDQNGPFIYHRIKQPCFPCGPASPCSPLSPGRPGSPTGPAGPIGPGSPCAP